MFDQTEIQPADKIDILVMQYIGYLCFRFIISLFSIIPFGVLYRLADILAVLLYRVIGYRKAVVIKQIRDSFPKKSAEEVAEIARLSYRNLADIILESLKGFSMTEADFRKRYVFINPSVSEAHEGKNGSCIQMAAHYGNWEWGAISYPLWFSRPTLGFYKPLTNPYIEKYSHAKRGKLGCVLIPIGQTAASFEAYQDKPVVYIFVSDQSTWSDNAHWVTFLGQDTACPQGGDKYAHQYNLPVYFVDIQRVSRGYYEVELTLLATNSADLPHEEITRRYMKHLEGVIREKPEDWLWSHKRWKKKR
jgi:KDO2-lipid IV(A) lauroyltransferase